MIGFLIISLKPTKTNNLETLELSEAQAASNTADKPAPAGQAALPAKIEDLHKLWGITIAEPNGTTSVQGEKGGSGTSGNLVISHVDPDSLGEKMGFRKGDEIIAIDQKRIMSLEDYARILDGTAGNNRALFYIKRGKDEFQLSIRLQKPNNQ